MSFPSGCILALFPHSVGAWKDYISGNIYTQGTSADLYVDIYVNGSFLKTTTNPMSSTFQTANQTYIGLRDAGGAYAYVDHLSILPLMSAVEVATLHKALRRRRS